MVWTFRNTTGGNAGVNRKLTVAEADGNTLMAKDAIATLQSQTGKQILRTELTDSRTALQVVYTDSTVDGPFPLPVATFNPVGIWQNDTPYAYLDVVTVIGVGTFACMIAHTSPSPPEEFDPGAVDESTDDGGLLWFQTGEARDVDVDASFSIIGSLPTAEENTASDADDDVLLGQYVVLRELIMEAPLTLGRAYLNTPVATGNATLSITKNGTSIGTIFFDEDDNFGVFTFEDDVEFTLGDRLGLVLIANDGFAADLAVTLPMRRTDLI